MRVEDEQRDDVDRARSVNPTLLPRRRALVAELAYVAGGGALFGSAFVRWVARGAGSGLRGHALVDAAVALGGTVPALSIGRLTVLWYLVPTLGAVGWIACGLGGPRRSRGACGRSGRARDHGGRRRRVRAPRRRCAAGLGSQLALAGAVLVGGGAWVPFGPHATR